MTLEPIDPETAVEWYLEDRSNELAKSSLKPHEYQLAHFIRWCEKEGIENLNSLTGRLLHRFRIWRRNDGDLNKVSEKKQMDTCRIFIRWLEAVDGVKHDLSEKVPSPSLSRGEDAREVMLESDQVSEILELIETARRRVTKSVYSRAY
jgi:site-specific recombinase XerD